MLDTTDFDGPVVIGINEDLRIEDALGLLDEIGGIGYSNLRGDGDQRARYHYRGLPYTVVLDREGRIVRSFYGFGTTVAPIQEAVTAELLEGSAGDTPPGDGP